MKYLLDTNILSEPLRPRPAQALLARLARFQEQLCTASVVWHELWFGCRRLAASAKRARIEHYFVSVLAPSLPRLAYDERAALWHAEERARLTALGRPPSFIDGQIAAIAATQGLVLVTRNQADFEGFTGLVVEDWTAGGGT